MVGKATIAQVATRGSKCPQKRSNWFALFIYSPLWYCRFANHLHTQNTLWKLLIWPCLGQEWVAGESLHTSYVSNQEMQAHLVRRELPSDSRSRAAGRTIPSPSMSQFNLDFRVKAKVPLPQFLLHHDWDNPHYESLLVVEVPETSDAVFMIYNIIQSHTQLLAMI